MCSILDWCKKAVKRQFVGNLVLAKLEPRATRLGICPHLRFSLSVFDVLHGHFYAILTDGALHSACQPSYG